MKKETSIETIITNYFSGEATTEEINKLSAWIEESAQNKNDYQRLKNIWEVAHPAFAPETIDTNKAYSSVTSKLFPAKWYNTPFILFWQKTAAILIIPILLFSVYLFINKTSEYKNITYQEVFAPYGTHAEINLPDGSTVSLNAGSSLKYPTVFVKGNRTVFLHGEAYFDVESDPRNPFTVELDNMKVKATGTAFNIEAYLKDSMVAVTMAKGQVEIMLANSSGFSLKGGERLGYNKNTTQYHVEKTNPYKWYAWKDNLMIFRNDPLEYVFKRLGNTFNIDITVKDPQIAKHLYRATFKKESLDEILRLLQMTAPIRYVDKRTQSIDTQNEKRQIEVFEKE